MNRLRADPLHTARINIGLRDRSLITKRGANKNVVPLPRQRANIFMPPFIKG